MNLYQITQWSHELFRLQVQEGGTYIDATMGKGRDTLFLCEMAKETGRVLAFDIQEAALCATDRLLKEQGVRDRAELYLDSHVHMDRYMPPESADGIYFNFGYLPGGDHRLATRGDTSVKAIDAGLSLLKKSLKSSRQPLKPLTDAYPYTQEPAASPLKKPLSSQKQ